VVKPLEIFPRAKSETTLGNNFVVKQVVSSKIHSLGLRGHIDRSARDGIESILVQDEHHTELLRLDVSEFFKVGLKRSKRKDIVLLPNDLLNADDEVEEQESSYNGGSTTAANRFDFFALPPEVQRDSCAEEVQRL
jgi:hypothetical protein